MQAPEAAHWQHQRVFTQPSLHLCRESEHACSRMLLHSPQLPSQYLSQHHPATHCLDSLYVELHGTIVAGTLCPRLLCVLECHSVHLPTRKNRRAFGVQRRRCLCTPIEEKHQDRQTCTAVVVARDARGCQCVLEMRLNLVNQHGGKTNCSQSLGRAKRARPPRTLVLYILKDFFLDSL